MGESKFKRFWIKVENVIDKILFPSDIKCIFCGNDVPNFDEKPYCEDCEKDIVFNIGHRCIICDEPIDNEATVCDNCQKHKRYFKRAFCPFVYGGVVRTAVLGYKDSNHRYKAKTFAKFIVDRINASNVKFDAVTFIPLTKKKEKMRTFNQSKLLANEIGKLLDVEVVDLFEKEKDSVGQKFLNYKQRQENMLGMYKLRPVKLRKDSKILIVDDIITTCATVNYCASLLSKKVGSVYVCAIARNKLRHKIGNDAGDDDKK